MSSTPGQPSSMRSSSPRVSPAAARHATTALALAASQPSSSGYARTSAWLQLFRASIPIS